MDVEEPEAWVVMVVLVVRADGYDKQHDDNMNYDDTDGDSIHDDYSDDGNAGNDVRCKTISHEGVVADDAAAGQMQILRLKGPGK